METMWEQVVIADFRILFQHSSVGTVLCYEKFVRITSTQLGFWPVYNVWMYPIFRSYKPCGYLGNNI